MTKGYSKVAIASQSAMDRAAGRPHWAKHIFH